jgi:nucleotide-binding universal stress UspA family protein
MFSTLIVPLDGSKLAERAVPYAIRLAQASRARLVLVQAVLASPSALQDGADFERGQLNAIAEARDYLTQMAESMSGQVGRVEIAVPYGRPAEKIPETIAAYEADGVVMTTHGRTGFDHLLHGSVTEALLARTSIPVFVVYARPGEASAPIFSPAHARLLVPQNGSDYDGPALRAAVEMLGPHGEIVLVMVVAPPEHVLVDHTGRHVLAYLDQQEEALTRQARDYLNEVAEPLRKGSTPINVKVDVRMGDPTSGIAMAALDAHADLIVMSTHGRTGVQRAVLGSVAGTVLRTVCTPVVLVRPNIAPPPEDGIDEPVDEEFREFGPVPTF